MKILTIGEFDPCSVALDHREVMRAAGHDYRCAVDAAYTARQAEADWQTGDSGELMAFASEADVIQLHPGIGQPWSFRDLNYHPEDAAPVPWEEISPHARIVFYFHGSRNAWRNREAYAAACGRRGALWTSTIDYAAEMPAKYIPPVPRELPLIAAARGEHMPLVVVHAPSDPGNCHTAAIQDICRRLGVPLVLCQRMPHAEVLMRKAQASAGFDHLRGAFSVNTLENAALGIVPLVGINQRWLHAMDDMPIPAFPPIQTATELENHVALLRDSVVATREAQSRARWWYVQWRAAAAKRLQRAYEEL